MAPRPEYANGIHGRGQIRLILKSVKKLVFYVSLMMISVQPCPEEIHRATHAGPTIISHIHADPSNLIQHCPSAKASSGSDEHFFHLPITAGNTDIQKQKNNHCRSYCNNFYPFHDLLNFSSTIENLCINSKLTH
jgi:hypothetical protein